MRRTIVMTLVSFVVGAIMLLPFTSAVSPVALKDKPASAAVYCSPFVNYWCYIRYITCGPFFYAYGYWIDNCGYVLY